MAFVSTPPTNNSFSINSRKTPYLQIPTLTLSTTPIPIPIPTPTPIPTSASNNRPLHQARKHGPAAGASLTTPFVADDHEASSHLGKSVAGKSKESPTNSKASTPSMKLTLISTFHPHHLHQNDHHRQSLLQTCITR